MTTIAKSKKKKINKSDLFFYIGLLTIPVIQFCIFYIGVNFNSLLLGFKSISLSSQGEYVTVWTLDTFKSAFNFVFSKSSGRLFLMSLVTYLFSLLIGCPLGLIFSFYIYKKFPLSRAFRVILFMPSIISSLVIVLVFHKFVDLVIPEFFSEFFDKTVDGLMSNPKTRFGTLMFYNIWISFGTTTLLYSNGMSGINKELVEASQIDGANHFQEFIHVSLPGIFPTLKTFLITGIAGLFVNQANLFSFYGNQAPEELQTFGYYLYKEVQMATSEVSYPFLAAIGLIFTALAAPLTFLIKWALDKFGPSEK